jgi:hypothetical protein
MRSQTEDEDITVADQEADKDLGNDDHNTGGLRTLVRFFGYPFILRPGDYDSCLSMSSMLVTPKVTQNLQVKLWLNYWTYINQT